MSESGKKNRIAKYEKMLKANQKLPKQITKNHPEYPKQIFTKIIKTTPQNTNSTPNKTSTSKVN